MFELATALKYLIPRKKQLSVSLISLMSVVVISLVVWLLLVFLSVTEGIEKGWLHKLTSLNAPIRITPTPAYFSSYYYRVDEVSGLSGYRSKTLGQKLTAPISDPYLPEEDGELPLGFCSPDLDREGRLKDPVKLLFSILSKIKEKTPDLAFQNFELSGALMRLQLLRPSLSSPLENEQSYLTQVSYLTTIPDKSPQFSSLISPPSPSEVNHLLYLTGYKTELSRQDAPAVTQKASPLAQIFRQKEILRHFAVEELTPTHSQWKLSPSLLPEKKELLAFAYESQGEVTHIEIPSTISSSPPSNGKKGKLWREEELVFFKKEGEQTRVIFDTTPVFIRGSFPLKVNKTLFLEEEEFPLFEAEGTIQHLFIKGKVPLEGLKISKIKNTSQIFPLKNQEFETGILIAKSYQDSGVLLGDRGYLSYSSATASSIQEHRLPIFVAGFYDPGILSIGNKCILVPPFITETINASTSSFTLSKTTSNGVWVWFNDLKQVETVKDQLLLELKEAQITDYWKVETYKDYDFAKDLLQQFHSDKVLFTLVGVIILIVACSNIISLLVLLVNDKKKEIGILQAMGATKWSVAAIFGSCGMVMGIASSLVGIGAALLTLQHLNSIVSFLSMLQGHEMFNVVFFGASLPNTLSHSALTFVLIATPILSIVAGLIPAWRACRLNPSEMLRSK